MEASRITKARFDALCVVRRVGTEEWAPEVEWWSIGGDQLIGVVSHDLSDDTWVWIVLGRDQEGVFRGIDLGHSLPTQGDASLALQAALESFAASGQTIFPQEGGKAVGNVGDLLSPIVSDERLHPHFKTLISARAYSPAAALLKEFSPVFMDVDGNFVEQFQTTGFNQRLWELYLDLMLREQGFHRVADFDRPDYCVVKAGFPVGIEAVTVNPSQVHSMPESDSLEEDARILSDFMPQRFSGPLTAKLGKRYWDLPHMKDVPLIIAIHDYFTDDSMTWSLGALMRYLYGSVGEGFRREDGVVDADFRRIEEHVWGEKSVPAGFFNQPEAENVSAVLANNAASLSKFNRIGKEAGLGDQSVQMTRIGHRWNPDPQAATPTTFQYEVSASEPRESWSDGLILFLNPNAKNQFPLNLFDVDGVHTFEEERVVSYLKEEHIFSSRTFINVPPETE